eukprot:gene2410-8723_t
MFSLSNAANQQGLVASNRGAHGLDISLTSFGQRLEFQRPRHCVIACDYKRDPSGYAPSPSTYLEDRRPTPKDRRPAWNSGRGPERGRDVQESPPQQWSDPYGASTSGRHESQDGQEHYGYQDRTTKRERCPLEDAIDAITTIADLESFFVANKGSLVLPEADLLNRVLTFILPNMHNLNTYESVVLLMSVAKLRYIPSVEWLGTYFEISLPILSSCGPGNLTVLIRALARLQLQPWDLKSAAYFKDWMQLYLVVSARKMKMFRGDQLVNMVCSLTDLQYTPDREWTALCCAEVEKKLESLDPGALTKGMLAVAKLQCKPEASFVKAFHTQLSAKLPMFDDRDMSTTIQAMSLLRRLIEHDFTFDFYSEVLGKLYSFSPASLSNMLVAIGSMVTHPSNKHYGMSRIFARQGFRDRMLNQSLDGGHMMPPVPSLPPPSQAWVTTVGDHVFRHMAGCNVNNLAGSVWALATLGYKPTGSMLNELIQVSLGKLHNLQTCQMIRFVQALGLFRYTPGSPLGHVGYDGWCELLAKLASRRKYDTKEVCDLVHALGELPGRPASLCHERFVNSLIKYTRMGHQPDFGFLHNYCQAARHMWQGFKPHDLATIAEAMASFQCPVTVDPLWSSGFMANVLCKLDLFDAPSLAGLMRGVARMHGLQPSAAWLAATILKVENLLPDLTGPQLGSILFSLSTLCYRPPSHVLDACAYCLDSRMEELSAEDAKCTAQALAILLPIDLSRAESQGYLDLLHRLEARQLAPAATSDHSTAAADLNPSAGSDRSATLSDQTQIISDRSAAMADLSAATAADSVATSASSATGSTADHSATSASSSTGCTPDHSASSTTTTTTQTPSGNTSRDTPHADTHTNGSPDMGADTEAGSSNGNGSGSASSSNSDSSEVQPEGARVGPGVYPRSPPPPDLQPQRSQQAQSAKLQNGPSQIQHEGSHATIPELQRVSNPALEIRPCSA